MEQVHIKVILNDSQPTAVFYPIGEAKVITSPFWNEKPENFSSPKTYITINQSYPNKLNYSFKKLHSQLLDPLLMEKVA